jgi:hypothetical protein
VKAFLLLALLLTFGSVSFGQTTKLKVYFNNEKRGSDDCGRQTFALTRQVPKTKGVAKAALDELFKGVTETEAKEGYSSLFSKETEGLVISVNIVRGIAYVNLKARVMEVLGNATTSCGSVSYYETVTRTLRQFPSIRKVMFAIERDPAAYYDWVQIGECPREIRNCSNKHFLK